MKSQTFSYQYSFAIALFMAVYMLMGVAHSTFSQVYPINATTQITPPYSVFISDYVAPGSEQLKLNLFLRDLTEPVYDVRIRLVIEGQGVRIETSPTYNPPPITIEGGLSTWLDATDLAPLFESRNLIFSGYSKSEFERYGRLPEGFYQFCFTVYDYRHPEIQLSQQSCQNLWLVRPDPPMLNQPACAAELELNEMQQSVIFQWTPMAISPNSSFTTDYIFRLYEIRSEDRNPADIVLSTNPIYELQTAETSLLYGVAEPPLVPGMEYVWQVQAVDLGGRDRFKNNGYSKISTYSIAENEEPLPEPGEFKAWGLNESMGMASWVPSLEPDGYTVEYRLADNPQAEWFVEELQLPPDAQLADSMYVVLQDLMAQTAYEVRVGSKRGAFVSSWTETKRFTTYPPREFACGDPQEVQQPLNTTPLISAIRGEVFTVGGFNMRLTKVTGGDGVFSGYGSVETPFLGVNLAVKFDNIRVNELYQVVDGEVIALSDGIDGFVEAWEDDEDTHSDNGENDADGESSDTNDDFDGVDIDYDGKISDVTVGDDGVIVVTDEDGMQTTYEQETDEETGEKKSVKITDSSGDIFLVDSDGNVTKGGQNNGSNTPDEGSQQQLTIEEKIVIAVLEDFKTSMEAWLEVHGKGPLSDYEMMWAEGLPGCLPEEPETVGGAQEYVTYLLEDKESLIPEFTAKMKDSPEWETITGIGENISDASEMTAENMDNAGEAVCPYILDEAINVAQCTRCPKPDYVGIEGEEAVTFDPDPVNVRRRGAKRWCYFEGYSQSLYYTAPESISETGAGWYAWDDYVKHVELIIESVAIISGDVALHPSNADGIIEYREHILEAFNAGRQISDNFKALIAKEYGRVSKEAFNKYSGSGYLEPVYPIYEVLSLFSGKQLVRGLVKFGNAFRALKNARGLLSYNFGNDVLKIFSKQGDEIAKVMDGAIGPVKFLDEGEEIAEIGGYKLLKQGDEIGFKALKSLADQFKQFRNISRLSDDVLKKLDVEGWTDDLLKKLDDDLAEPKLFKAFNEQGLDLDPWKLLSNGKASLRSVDNVKAVDAFKKANPNITDDAIQSAFDELKASRKQSFMNGLKNVADNDLGLTKARKARPNEVKDAINNLRDFRKSRPDVLSNSNVARLEGSIDGKTVSKFSEHRTWVGGEQNVLTPRPSGQSRIWQASEVQTSSGYTYLADIDSEYNMLTDLARKLEPNARVGDVFYNHTGQLQIVSEIAYCKSCQGIIQKFNNMFPGIEIILIDGIK
ncbi:hypothetical protein JMN32_20090 [Fulvivirga sp. 29W222]|uniref:Fibronectin type-III domain-containing protein n=1 Tax=Fulvivirga marina TaxID=2494733 RepID=A0A937KFY1_9BACT|nr:deaminase domain-containing protein [Fulvivirga marina]MBL6448623.1 hypothetical protein [Fulvivirga marina]